VVKAISRSVTPTC